MKRVGIVSNNKYQNKIIEDLSLKSALAEEGILAEIISWENPNNEYDKYDCLVIRSIWGYQNDYSKFKKWLQLMKENSIVIYNSIDMIKQNIVKDKQFEILDKNGVEHIETIFQKGFIDTSKIGENQIIKPIISGSGNNTYKFNQYDLLNLEMIVKEEDNGIMIQPYEKSIENGEFSIVFIDKENTHNMIRYPGILYKKQKPYELKSVPDNVLKLAKKVMSIPDYNDALYMRVDIVDEKVPKVMEVELTDPDLLTRYISSNEPIKKLSKGIKRRI